MRASLLKARIASIIAYNKPSIPEENEPEENKDENCLCVYLRIKAGVPNYEDLYEVQDSKTLISKVPEGCFVARNFKDGDLVTRKYEFSKIYGPTAEQTDVFDELVKPRLLKFINGDNCTVMTYGASGSGKTYTIVGTGEAPGMLPRSLEFLFKTLPKLPDQPTIKPLPNHGVVRLSPDDIKKELEIKRNILNYNWPNVDRSEHINTYRTMQSRLSNDPVAFLDDISDVSIAVWVSFTEIYNEHVHDLLQPEPPNGKTKQKLKLGNVDGHTYVKNLTYVTVSSGLEAFQVLQYGLHHLNYAKTKVNAHSSRSHSIFSIKLTQAKNSESNEFYVSHFNFCDLAGAERLKRTLNVGERLKESNNINTSLLVLGRCIAGIRNAQKISDHRLIPFRESKLTQIFQKALSGYEDISMIVNINPCRESFDETQHVLNFSAVAKEIVITSQPKVPTVSSNPFPEASKDKYRISIYAKEDSEILEEERIIEELKNQISEYTTKHDDEFEDQQQEEHSMISEIMTRYACLKEEETEQMEAQLSIDKIITRREFRRKLKAAKPGFCDSSKENNYSLSSSSDSSEDEENQDPSNWLNRKRKRDVLQTIVISSSDEEDDIDVPKEYINIWKEKIRVKDKQINEHHKTINALKEEITKLRAKNQEKSQEFDRKIREQNLRIERLKKQLDESIMSNLSNLSRGNESSDNSLSFVGMDSSVTFVGMDSL